MLAAGTSSPELARTGEGLDAECLLVSSGLTWTREPAVTDSVLPGITLVLQLLPAAGEPSGSRGAHDSSAPVRLTPPASSRRESTRMNHIRLICLIQKNLPELANVLFYLLL